MLKQNARFVELGVRVLDWILLALALPAAHVLYGRASLARAEPPPLEQLWVAAVGVLILWAAVAGAFQVYGAYRTRSVAWEAGRLAQAVVAVGLASFACLFAANSHLPRLFVGLYFGCAFVMLVSARLALRGTAHALRRRGYNTRTYAIVGTGAAAEEVERTFAEHPHWGFQLAGYVLPDTEAAPAPAGKILGTLDDIERILDENVLDEIVFAVPRDDLPRIERAIRICEEQGVPVVVSLEPLHIGTGNMSVLELSDLSMLVFTRTPSDALALAAKRLFDIVVSATALLLLAPLFLVVAIVVAVESPGPIFFRQTRVGLNGRAFVMYKFRSMYADAEQRLEALLALNEMDGPVFKMRDDPRITRIGRFIRKTSIDELPQFWNVLCGEMSIVGPRPPIPAEVRQYKRWQRRRLSVKPGITCTWQVSGRNGIDFEQWMQLDLDYIDNWSLWKDLQIFVKTIPAVLTSRGAS